MDHLGHVGRGQVTWNEWVVAISWPSQNRNPSGLAMIIPFLDMHGMIFPSSKYGYVIQVLKGCTLVGFVELGGGTSKLDN